MQAKMHRGIEGSTNREPEGHDKISQMLLFSSNHNGSPVNPLPYSRAMGRGTDYLPLGYFLAQREGEEARRGLIGQGGEGAGEEIPSD